MEKEKFDIAYEHLMEEYSIIEEIVAIPLALLPFIPSLSTLTKAALVIYIIKALSQAPEKGAELLKWLESDEVKRYLKSKDIDIDIKDIVDKAKRDGIKINFDRLKTLMGDKKFYSEHLKGIMDYVNNNKTLSAIVDKTKELGSDIMDNAKNNKFNVDYLRKLSQQRTPTVYRTPRLNLVGKIGSK